MSSVALYPRPHYQSLRNAIAELYALFAEQEIDAARLNARLSETVGRDPFSTLILLPDGPGGEERQAFLARLGLAAGEGGADWRAALAGVLETAPLLGPPADEVQTRFAAALPLTLGASEWLAQVQAIMTGLALDAGSDMANFQLAVAVSQQLSELMGYLDYARASSPGYIPPGGTPEEWGEGYTGGRMRFIDPFATEPARIRAAQVALQAAEGTDGRLRAQLLGWLIDPNFEYYMGVGPMPAELPPAMAAAAPGMARLYAELIPAIMADFAGREAEILAE
ncbi:MAG: hypothetical protein Q4G26_04400 [Paracoccus sp. (in: a-proteobacteria)]|nr:hypothetical protein [Paracoccus sp. (in: a-proteobacteria)]